MGSSFPTNKGVQKSGLTWNPRGDSWTLRDHVFHGVELSRLLCTIFPCRSSSLTLDVCHFAGKDAQLLQHRAVPAELLPLGFTSRPLGARRSCKKSPSLACREPALSQPKTLSRSWNPLFLTFRSFVPCPLPQGFAAGLFLAPGRGQGKGAEPWAGSGLALHGLRLPPCVLPQNCSAGC